MSLRIVSKFHPAWRTISTTWRRWPPVAFRSDRPVRTSMDWGDSFEPSPGSTVQWAAVSTHDGAMTVPPQNWAS
jgi:hypothetical protein